MTTTPSDRNALEDEIARLGRRNRSLVVVLTGLLTIIRLGDTVSRTDPEVVAVLEAAERLVDD